MKYGKILENNIIFEYKNFYIDYKYLKQNILKEKKEFVLLLTREINKVENFFLENEENMSNINNFCLFNLFSILKIIKKYQKKNNIEINDTIYDVYFKKSFYLYLISQPNINDNNSLNDYKKCSICYDRNVYIFQNKQLDDNKFICNNCSLGSENTENSIVIALEEITKNTFNPFYLPLIKYPKRCLFVGIDGLRPDCLLYANTPNIDKLINNGVYNFDTKITTDSYSAPSWGAILSGYSQKILKINSNECVENDNFKWSTINIFNRLNYKNVSTYSITSTWNGMKNLVQDSKMKSHHNENLNVLENDKQAINETIELLHQLKNNSFVFLYLNGIDFNGHKYGFSLQSKEYIKAIETIDKYLQEIIKICIQQHISIILTTDHGGSRKTDLCNNNIENFFKNKSLHPQSSYKGIHGLNCPQHNRVFQIYFGNIINFQKKEDINIESNLNIYKKIIQYYD
uniref:Alkaline Phosphatase Family Protein n=1 Tax=Florenciella sp. virus SA2 TaxID=3240092 RepID=A0AB39J6W8_9VIRU